MRVSEPEFREAPLPADETQRLQSLHKLNILDTPIEERFERITRLASRLIGVPITAFTLIDEGRQWFKSIQGMDGSETPRPVSFCAHAILQDDVFLIPDATKDNRFAGNPQVVGHPNIGAYAGCPVHAPDGMKIGTFCAVGTKPQEWSEDQISILRDMALLIETELRAANLSRTQQQLIQERDEAQRLTLIDPLTRIWNRRGITTLLEREWAKAIRYNYPVSLAVADIDHFKSINDNYGHGAGDAVLQAVAKLFLAELRGEDALARMGGEEFLIMLPGSNASQAQKIVERLRITLEKTNISTGDKDIQVTSSFGVATTMPGPNAMSIDALIAHADKALYEAKRSGRNCTACAA